jgi:hypothetical protein
MTVMFFSTAVTQPKHGFRRPALCVAVRVHKFTQDSFQERKYFPIVKIMNEKEQVLSKLKDL